MFHQIRERIPAQAQQRLGQVEPGCRIEIERRIDAARDRQHRQQHAEDQDEEQPPQKIGDREHQAAEAIDDEFEPAAAKINRPNRRERGQGAGHRNRDDHQFKRRRKPAHDQPHHAFAQADRGAEVAAQYIAHPGHELFRNRCVEAVERTQPADILRRRARRHHHGDRIARHHAHQHEYQNRHADQGGDGPEQAAEDVVGRHGRSVTIVTT